MFRLSCGAASLRNPDPGDPEVDGSHERLRVREFKLTLSLEEFIDCGLRERGAVDPRLFPEAIGCHFVPLEFPRDGIADQALPGEPAVGFPLEAGERATVLRNV